MYRQGFIIIKTKVDKFIDWHSNRTHKVFEIRYHIQVVYSMTVTINIVSYWGFKVMPWLNVNYNAFNYNKNRPHLGLQKLNRKPLCQSSGSSCG